MKKMKRILQLLVTAVLFCTMPVVVNAEEHADQAVILHTNDIHAAIDHYSLLAAYRQELLNDGYDVMTVDAGDAIQGEPIGLITEGKAVADLMNAVPYDLAVPGNHEFDFGMDAFLDLANDKEEYPSYQYICSNFIDLKTDEPVFKPYVIRKLKGHQVGFVGVDTPETYTKSTPVYFQDENGSYIYSFDEDRLYETVQNAVDNARKDGAEYVIVISHLGNDGVSEKWSSKELIAHTNGIDALIDGHDHQIEEDSYPDKDGKKVILAETGYSFQNIGKMTLTFGKDGIRITDENVPVSSLSVAKDAQKNVRQAYQKVQKKIDSYQKQVAYMYETIGQTETDLSTLDSDNQWLARYEETALGDYTADAYQNVLKADIGFVNGGGVRGNGIFKGEISRKDMMDVNPWNNEMGVITVNRKQILDYLETTVSSDWDSQKGHMEPNGSFVQTSGLTYEVHLSDEASPVVKDEKGMYHSFDETKKRRIANVRVNGKDLDPEKTYTIAGSLYVIRDSDEAAFAFGKDSSIKKSDLHDADILMQYLQGDLKGTISAEDYGKTDNRIQVVYEPSVSIDLTSVAWTVIRGDYGNGAVRVRKLREAGYDAITVQKRVNELMAAIQ